MPFPERLGKYFIRGELGRGAMGIVYEGFDPLIERTVAVKVLHVGPGQAALAAELRQRFRREAQAAGRLSHPNIVAVYDYGEIAESSSAYIAMELVQGRDLRQLFDAGTRFPLHETGRLMAQLLAALQHAHERGVVHRDIKPGNIIVLGDGTLKVADFGIARLDTSELTQTGSVLGTLSHMSPEQLRGEPVDGRSDLYSCGVILYQLLTGERPFNGSPAQAMQQVLHEEPPSPSGKVPGLPAGLDAVVRQAMAKSPHQRHADAASFAEALRLALEPAADPETTLAAPASPAARPARKAPLTRLVLACGLGLAAAAAVGVALWPQATSPGSEPECAVEARSGDAHCQVVMGLAYRFGKGGVPKDEAQALDWLRKAANQGDRAGQYELGLMLLQGLGGPPADARGAARWFRKSAEQGEPRAQNRMGLAHENGEGVDRSDARAAEWYRKAADQGFASSLNNLGRLHLHGRGVPKDTARAAELLERAAEKGEGNARYHLGWMYEKGEGRPRDERQAARLYRQALATTSISHRNREAAKAFLAANPSL
jgi:TPR repeat protein